MMRIRWYDNEFAQGRRVTIQLARHSTWTLNPPDPDDPEKGPDVDTNAAGVIAACRAFSGWLAAHARLHPGFHKKFKGKDPGGELPQPYGRRWGVQLRALPDQPYLWCPDEAGTLEMAEGWVRDYDPTLGAVVVYRNLGPIREYSYAAAGQPI